MFIFKYKTVGTRTYRYAMTATDLGEGGGTSIHFDVHETFGSKFTNFFRNLIQRKK